MSLDNIYAYNQQDLAEKRRVLRRVRRGLLNFNNVPLMRPRHIPIPPLRFNDKYPTFRLQHFSQGDIDDIDTGMMDALTTCIRQTSIKDVNADKLKCDDFWEPRITYGLHRYLPRPRADLEEKFGKAMQFSMPQIRAVVDGLDISNRSSIGHGSSKKTALADPNSNRVKKHLYQPRHALLFCGKHNPKSEGDSDAGGGTSNAEPDGKNTSEAEEERGGN